MRSRSRWSISLGLILALSALAAFFWLQQRGDSVPLGERTYVLVLGLDDIEGRSRSDTLIVAGLEEGRMVLLSIPRDLRLKFPDGNFHKVNAAYALGGAALARRVVSRLLGVDLHHYAVVDYEGFKQLVDMVGGVTVNVEEHLKYDDEAQNLHIDLAPGVQTLDGAKALDYVRYRDDQGDFARIRRQQKLLQAVLAKGLQFDPSEQWTSLLKMAYRYLRDTDLSLMDVVALAKRMQGLDASSVVMVQVPGTPVEIEGISYLEPDVVRTAALVERYLLGRDVLLRSDVRVAVLNGNGTAGLAGRIGQRLRAEDFQVTHIGNAENFDYPESLIVDLSGDEARVRLLLEVLGPAIRVVAPQDVQDHLQAIRQRGYAMDDADLLFIAGAGFALPPPPPSPSTPPAPGPES